MSSDVIVMSLLQL